MPAPDPVAPSPRREGGAAFPDRAAAVRRSNDGQLLRALLVGVLVGVLVDAVILVWAATVDGAALGSALLGTALALVITVPTVLTARLTRNLPPMTWAGAVMGGWLVKMLVLLLALAAIVRWEWVERPWLGGALLAGALAAALVETWGLVRVRPRLEVADPAADGSANGS